MHQRKGKKILIFFFLLLLVGSINNISLNNLKFREINNINVSGLGDNSNAIILEKIKKLNLENIFSLNRKKIANQIDTNSLVESYVVFKTYPSSLNIKINKTKFLARVNISGKIFLVGSNGKLIENKFSNNKLPFIFGNPDIYDFLNFKDIIDKSIISYEDVENLYYFSSKRWDLELKNNVIIKLPKNYSKESLDLALEFLHSNEFRDIKIIDARIKNQIILDD